MAHEPEFKVIVSGDRYWGTVPKTGATEKKHAKARAEANIVFRYLDKLHGQYPGLKIIQGEAPGVDTLARVWAEHRGVPQIGYPAEWNRYRNGAGPKRNEQMLVSEDPALVVAFHAFIPNSKGTKSMVRLARAAGVPTVIVGKDGEEYEWLDNEEG